MKDVIEKAPRRSFLIIVMVSFFCLLGFMTREIGVYDEGIVLSGALRTLAGEIPHRDYYSNYGPAQNYIVGALFYVFGSEVYVARLYSVFINVGIVSAAFLITFRRTGHIGVGMAVCVILFFLIGWQFHLYPIYPVILLALISSLFLLPQSGDLSLMRIALAGIGAGAAALFRYDGGFFILASHCAAIMIISASEPFRRSMKIIFIRCCVYATGAAVAFFPFAISYLAVAPISAFFHDIIEFPILYYSAMRGLPFPGLLEVIRHPVTLAIYFPIIVLFFSIIEIFIYRPWLRASAADQKQFPVIVLMGILSTFLFYKGIVRVSAIHMMMSSIPAAVLLAVLVDRIASRGHHRKAAIIALVATLAPALGVARELVLDLRQPNRAIFGWLMTPSRPVTNCTSADNRSLFYDGEQYLAVKNYILQNSNVNERIFVGLSRHDRIFVNPMFLYFGTKRLPGTHWHQFDPGLQTRSDIQRLMISNLKQNDVRWVIRDSSFNDVVEPNMSSVSSGVRLLDEYLLKNYRPVARQGNVEIWLDKLVPKPQRTSGTSACIAQSLND